MRISKYFTYKEVIHSKTAIAAKIDNELPSIYFQNAIDLGENVLDPIRERFGAFSPKSWYRCPKLNSHKDIKGSKTSDHMTASAADIKIKGVKPIDLYHFIRENLKYKQVILEPRWVHVSYVKGDLKKEDLVYYGGHYISYEHL
jgi:hypothetical protein